MPAAPHPPDLGAIARAITGLAELGQHIEALDINPLIYGTLGRPLTTTTAPDGLLGVTR